MNKAVFFDRDGTLIEQVDYLADPDKAFPRPEAVDWVKEANARGFLAVVVTNQSGVARGYYSEDDVRRVNARVREIFAEKDARIDAFFHCPHHPEFPLPGGTPCDCRKPDPGMIRRACDDLDIDPARSALIGDSKFDLEAGRRGGLSAVFDAGSEGDALLDWIRGRTREPRRYSLFDRESRVSTEDFPRLPEPKDLKGRRFLKHLPDLLAGRDWKRLVDALRRARSSGKLIGWALGGHVAKVGLAPYLNGLMEEGFVSFLASNAALPIHDLEIALAGRTSEDVESSLNEGKFGMARETGDAFAEILKEGAKGAGFGEAVGAYIEGKNLPHRDMSMCAKAHALSIPFGVFPALGAEITAMHPGHSGAALGKAAEIDFLKLVDALPGLSGGGVWLNVGSAVILPEVFLKALSLAINLFGPIEGYTTANLDMIQHYRPRVNVVQRPGSEGVAITGHHEIMIPLLYFCLHEEDP